MRYLMILQQENHRVYVVFLVSVKSMIHYLAQMHSALFQEWEMMQNEIPTPCSGQKQKEYIMKGFKKQNQNF